MFYVHKIPQRDFMKNTLSPKTKQHVWCVSPYLSTVLCERVDKKSTYVSGYRGPVEWVWTPWLSILMSACQTALHSKPYLTVPTVTILHRLPIPHNPSLSAQYVCICSYCYSGIELFFSPLFRLSKLLLRLPALRLMSAAVTEELFFAGLIGNVQIDSIIPYILKMESTDYNSQVVTTAVWFSEDHCLGWSVLITDCMSKMATCHTTYRSSYLQLLGLCE